MIDINKLIMESMKAHDTNRTNALKNLKAKILEFKTAKNAKQYNESAEIAIIQKMVKELNNDIMIYNNAGRAELANESAAQLNVLQDLLPPIPTVEDIKRFLLKEYPNGIEKKQMGIAIKKTKESLIGVDGAMVANIVKNIIK